jgi:outer membrane protein OmpA-like peptidoglycan-associated protein
MVSLCHRTVAAFLLSVLIGSTAVAQSTIEDEIRQTRERIEAARTRQLDLIAPKSFTKATERFQRAEERYAKGEKIEDIRESLAKIGDDLARCEALEEIGKVILRDALVARADADKAKAPTLSERLWADAEKTLIEAGQNIESGDQNGARSKAKDAVTIYRDAELQAIRTDILGSVWVLRDEAEGQKASERASRTQGMADDLLAQAEEILAHDRYARPRAQEKARQAADAYKHTLWICEQVAELESDRKSAPERLILGYEAEIAKVATAVGIDANFAEGVATVTDKIVGATNSTSKERDGLRAELDKLENDVESARTQVAMLSDRDAKLQQKEKHEMKMQEVRAVFKRDEADVLLRGSQLIIRLYGLSFPVGSSEIRPENFALLSKIRRVLAEFPDSKIAIEGHTDSSGSTEMNQSLSQNRANAVREYLLANMSMDESLVSSVGYGESRPIANNETKEGRAKNRRIDLTLDLSGS